MPPSTFRYPSSDGARITAYRWDPAGEPRAAIQLTHGMGEHAQRYDRVARALNDAGFAVYAQDHRGHGASANGKALGDLGPGSWPALVADIGLLSARIREDRPGLPLILVGHSMGSFAVQQYLLDHSADVDGVVLTGTAAIDVLEPALDLDQPLDLAMFNVAFISRSSLLAPTSTGCPATRRSSTPTSPIRTAASGSTRRRPSSCSWAPTGSPTRSRSRV
jgi:alpha-beta hydrolase superfamily lysophospholipase